MRVRNWLCLAAVASLAACASKPSWKTAPSGAVRTSGTSSTERPATNVQKAPGFQIAQCFSPGAPRVGISYPAGWSQRVSRAETEDELLGGASRDLSKTSAFARPVGGPISYTYPSAALNSPTEGICEVKFNLSRQGDPSNVVSACSSSLFVQAATEAVAGSKFEPIRVNGVAAKGVNLTYDMKFCLAD